MERSAHMRSGFWITVVPYALAMAVLVSLLKYVEYRYWIRDLRMEVYVGVVAVLFTGLGVWVGSKLLADKKEREWSPFRCTCRTISPCGPWASAHASWRCSS